ncbi:MAG: efflux RND transporter periplasmic adaptor subunit [Xanthomonadales bacterium]|nr:efflux RND transporter periplasmic adaptor subunit [Gammaproteobacteria bacterium]MBT8054895.1 efflux RND transporter periplasmic adaptor subunit [Gammaproteobacteria bacterium]NND58174.1 efflux RND transporter periplasmic adaptor subunit [Xanthomonadales bacterium]NNK50031.1 efflux RND transporter periplasmic adaptor subunit [Xanthomonadales bacterium]
MKKILIFAVLAALLVGIPVLTKVTGGSDAKEVELSEVESKLIKSSILASGTLAFREQVQLRSEVIGQVIELHVEEADTVEKGQLVITLDPKTYQAQVDQAQARVRIQEIAIDRQRLLIQNTEERFERQKALFSSNLVDENSFDLLENELSLARVDLLSLQESLSQARAALDQARELLAKTQIRSPIDGIVIQIDVKVGETVIAGTTNIPGSTMMVIADPSETLTEVQVDEADIAQVRENQRADIYAAAWPDSALSGTVQSIASVARRQQGQQSLSFLVKILLDEQDRMQIRPGMSVRADIYTETSEETLAIPVQAVLYDEELDSETNNQEDQPYVYVIEDGKAVRKDVKIGISSDSDQEILEGLSEGDRVISGPFRTLRHLNEDDEVEEIAKQDDSEEGDSTVTVSVGD